MGARAAQKKSGEIVIKADELRSFVGSKREVWWVWAALDSETRQVVAMVAGDRSVRTARCRWPAGMMIAVSNFALRTDYSGVEPLRR